MKIIMEATSQKDRAKKTCDIAPTLLKDLGEKIKELKAEISSAEEKAVDGDLAMDAEEIVSKIGDLIRDTKMTIKLLKQSKSYVAKHPND